MKEVGAAATAKGMAVLDCPVSGSPNEAGTGKLVLLVGGEAPTLERAGPLFDLLGQTWQHTGAVGTAKVVKLVNNMMSMGNVLVASEAFALGVAAGVEPQKLFDVISVSGGRSHHFTKRFPNALAEDFAPGFKMELGEKDLSLGVDLGRAMKMPTPAASLAREMYALAVAEGYKGQDIVALMDMYRQWAKGRG
jgi:3-hydroxyisobutyrate dehydrogenase